MRVIKFGGSSLANGQRFNTVCDIIEAKSQQAPVAIVVSAPQGVTNHLLAMTEYLHSDSIEQQLEQYQHLVNGIFDQLDNLPRPFNRHHAEQAFASQSQKLKRWLNGAAMLDYCPDHIRAQIICTGERLSVAILEALLNTDQQTIAVFEPELFLRTNESSLDAVADLVLARQLFSEHYSERHRISVMPGFIGVSPSGKTTTLGRNGSDYSAAVLSVCVNAQCCEIWTDVDGVYNADPRLIKDASLLEHLSYQEAMELSYFGAKVLHPKTIGPIAQHHIPCLIKNTLNLAAKGTLISDTSQVTKQVKAISNLDELTMINVSGPGMKGMVGMASRIFACMSNENISLVLISQSSSEYCISFCVYSRDAYRAQQSLQTEFELELLNQLLDPIDMQSNLSIVSLVGDGMHHQRGVAGKLFSSLAQARVNVIAIAQDSSERSISVVIEQRKSTDALKVCHQNFFSKRHTIDVFIVGCGVVGSALLTQIGRQQASLKKQGIDLKVYGIANSKGVVFNRDGICTSEWQTEFSQAVDLKKEFSPLSVSVVKDFVREQHLINPVLVDCTSDSALSRQYVDYLDEGFHVITPNKKANTDSWQYYRQLRDAARKTNRLFLYETNVGAGLPVIDTLQKLFQAGDKLVQFEGVLSGSLSYIFGQLDQGVKFSKATQIAKQNGFTEPDPRDDLSGMDVARKLLIMAREAGMALELEHIKVAPILPDNFDTSGSVDDFMQRLSEVDDYFVDKASSAQQQGKRLRYVGKIVNGECQVSIEAVTSDHPLYAIKDGENALSILSHYYQPIPLVLRGYGAGADVTAAGVFSDILRTQAWKQDI
ncbi:bifunctional aspartate kinase/homoserine dehydrogenase I [Thalassotalea ponticola]|uniref:bifunctional aspartate kinase/homoserine dehydrogenase I n=1 Tax=Thalassotalea ponticola TaxID=1523392 RepID=UPI0025B32662|nr:bifunctional aspartate kinase/homoserine dehydrogenase I [Thalassotalea ponticola]MDN3652041.1 bifunctional aspartate kinase/homoserine dehydrogenase I [Thalassotalea ponticola]